MCSTYLYDGKEYSTIKEILEFIPRECFVIKPTWTAEISDESCLCPIDAFATGKQANMRVVQSPMYYHWGNKECEIAIKDQESLDDCGWYRTE